MKKILAALFLFMSTVAASATTCPVSNVYPFVTNCPLDAAGLNKSFAATQAIIAGGVIPGLPSSDPNIDDTCGNGTQRCLQNKISYSGSPLAAYFVQDPFGLFLYIWDPVNQGPVKKLIGSTNIMPTFAISGDIEIGDDHRIAKNPIGVALRVETGLPATSTTVYHSAAHENKDVDGGATIALAPTTGTTDSDGYVNITAFGKGSGASANLIMFNTRSGVDTATQRGYVAADGIHSNYDLFGTTMHFGTSTLTMTGGFATTLTATGATTATLPSGIKTLMASDYSNGSSLGAANSFLTSNGTGIPNAVAITGLVDGQGAGAPIAYTGVTGQAHKWISALDLHGAGTLTQPATTDISDIATFSLSTSGTIKTTNTTDATSATTGALQTSGGLGVAKDIYTGNAINILGNWDNNTLNGLHIFFNANIGSIYSLQNGIVWRQLDIDGLPTRIGFNSGGNVVINGAIQLGGTTNAFPSIRVSGTETDFTLADNSAFSAIKASSLTLTTSLAGNITISGNNTYSGTFLVTSTGLPTLANGNSYITNSAGTGGQFGGQGAVNDACLMNKSQLSAACVPTGTINLDVAGALMVGSTTPLTLATGQIGIQKITDPAAAVGAAGGGVFLVCGTNAGTAKLVAIAGTSATKVTIVDNIGAGVTGC